MPGCGMHSRPKLAEKARYNSLLKINNNNNNNNNNVLLFGFTVRYCLPFGDGMRTVMGLYTEPLKSISVGRQSLKRNIFAICREYFVTATLQAN